MSSENPATALPPLRQRRRAAAVQEVVDAAERHIAEHGPAALSLRAVARGLGMTVQALYHYFPNRDALVTALIAKAYGDLADALQRAVDSAEGDPDVPPLMVVAGSYRRWAVEHPALFQLLYGAPLRHYTAPPEGPTTQAVRRMGTLFERALFDGYTAEQFAAADLPELSASFREFASGLPPGGGGGPSAEAAALFLGAWGRMHGLVALEVFGHTSFVGDHQAEIFRVEMENLHQDIRKRLPAAAPAAAPAGRRRR
ncbi:TetR/AcrR family transcriptional regulator [Streptomyces zingiberis]|uniref:TetR/AcrR family transcriptional regulator n=1 Tax=Streptomyces zingiberis TaxID=2053010 RepID=A0ABX1BTR6_9ACTN|nr:TetR/AcrR family transcriptional regulator [Streptomyces zingiberis]NJQ01111.1 TetR/AcrR family transcriptional regulator [Streptomyces zingiberis]